MTVLDYAVLTIIGLSVLLSAIRGLVREVLALLAWAVGFIVASLLAADLAVALPSEIPDERLRSLVAFAGIFLAVLLLMSLLAMGASRLIRNAGLGVEDRVLGGVFGLVRGTLVVMVLVLAAGFTALPRQPVWREAALSGPLQALAGVVKGWLPARLSQRISYD
jgi:membrane protein required for colicin V production